MIFYDAMKAIMVLSRNDIVHPELSYLIVGVLFDLFRKIGPDHKEQYYQRAIALELQKRKIQFRQELYVPLYFDNKIVGRYFLDFCIENTLILEIKRGDAFNRYGIPQLFQYLQSTGLQLGILATFTSSGVRYRRIVNVRK